MDGIGGWIMLAVWLVTPLLVIGGALSFLFSRKPVEKKYQIAGAGIVGGFDAVWSPTALEAGIERDRQTKRTAPAPAPGDPPWTINDDRIRIDV